MIKTILYIISLIIISLTCCSTNRKPLQQEAVMEQQFNENSVQQETVFKQQSLKEIKEEQEHEIEQRRFFNSSRQFSVLPLGPWKAIEIPGLEIEGIKIEYLGINIGFDVFIDTNLSKRVDKFLEKLNVETGKNYTILHRGDFITLSNIKGEKVTVNITLAGYDLRQIIYFFPGKYNKIVQAVGSLAIAEGKNKEKMNTFEESVDEIMRSFEWNDNTENSLPDDGTHFIEESGGFSFIPYTQSWRYTKGSKYKTLKFEKQENNDEARVIFFMNTFRGRLNVFSDAFLKQYIDGYGEKFKVLERNVFIPITSGIGEKIICLFNDNGVYYRLTFYFFPGTNYRICTALCYALVEDDDFYIDVFDRTMETFKWLD